MLGGSLAAQPEHETISVNRTERSSFRGYLIGTIQRRIREMLLSILANFRNEGES